MIVVLFEQSVYGETVRLGYLVLDQKWDPGFVHVGSSHPIIGVFPERQAASYLTVIEKFIETIQRDRTY